MSQCNLHTFSQSQTELTPFRCFVSSEIVMPDACIPDEGHDVTQSSSEGVQEDNFVFAQAVSHSGR